MDETFDKIDEMLTEPNKLTKSEHAWVKKIDKTVARFENTAFTPRQREVINDIYSRFKKK